MPVAGFAMSAVVSADDRSSVLGIGMEPGHREVGALMRCLATSGRLVPAGRARARRGCRWIGNQDDVLCDRRDVHAFVQMPIHRGAGHLQHVGDLGDGVIACVV